MVLITRDLNDIVLFFFFFWLFVRHLDCKFDIEKIIYNFHNNYAHKKTLPIKWIIVEGSISHAKKNAPQSSSDSKT